MDWTTIILSLIASLIPSGGIAWLFFFKENKRARQLENETTASAQWRELYEKSEAKVESQSLKIEALYKENKMLREDNNGLTTQRAVLSLLKCKIVGCATRVPPLGEKEKEA